MSNNTVYSNPAPPPVQPKSNNLKKLHYLWLPLVWVMEYMIFACWWMTVAVWRMCVGMARFTVRFGFWVLVFSLIGWFLIPFYILAKLLGVGKDRVRKPLPKPWAPWFASITK